mmetsp:Transcript_30926/g.60966  ORF Transcript_30926/g.60966 Transcript_30926/m.60966 type:complete len:80 (-) Transcript_30926:165-404(-)
MKGDVFKEPSCHAKKMTNKKCKRTNKNVCFAPSVNRMACSSTLQGLHPATGKKIKNQGFFHFYYGSFCSLSSYEMRLSR